MSAAEPFLNAIAKRRSLYHLDPKLPSGVAVEDIRGVVGAIIKETPTSHNTQTNRAIILVGERHRQVWDTVLKSVTEEHRKLKLRMIRDEAYGSVIFFWETSSIEKLQEEYPHWSSEIPLLAEHSSGAVQINVWTAFSELGLGGHLQHYNPYVAAALAADIPRNWKIRAQLAFGLPVEDPTDKTYIENPVKVLA